MKNKNEIRKKLENGKFTTIHNSILFDTRLTPNAFRLMTAILSDSDTHFNLSQTLYCKRLKIAKQTFFNAIAKLEECGYLKKTPTGVNNTFNYSLSEYGNLNTASESTEDKVIGGSTETSSETNFETKQMPLEYYQSLQAFSDNYNYLMCDDFFFNVFKVDVNTGVDYDIIIAKFEKYLYKTTIASITDSHINPKAFEDFKTSLKSTIFNHKNYKSNFMSSWNYKKLTTHKKQAPRDYETEMFDYYENPED
jgi:hypothetical protein